MDFKTYIKKLRVDHKGWSQEEASKKLGVSLSSVQNWERGDNKPDMNSISNIAKVYNVKSGDILNVIAKELDEELFNDNYNSIKNKKEEYLKVMPEGLDYSAIEDLSFTAKEQDLFLILALCIETNDNPISLMHEKTLNYLEIALFLDKLNKFKLYKTYDNGTLELTEQGKFVFNKIKLLNYRLFDINYLDFKSFVDICKLYNIDKYIYERTSLLEEIVESKEYYLDDFEETEDRWSNKVKYSRIQLKTKKKYVDNSRDYYRRHSRSERCLLDRKDALEQYLTPDYYTILEIECDDEVYNAEKELYLKKLAFYEENKELNDGLIEPDKFQERIRRKVVPTEKAIKFVKYLNK